jgi:hypothetical protein
MSGPTFLLDERLGFHNPRGLSRRGGPWYLGHAKAEVGAGWWGLLRIGFRRVEQYSPDVSVLGVRALNGRLIFYAAFGELTGYGREVFDKKVSHGGKSISLTMRDDMRHTLWEERQALVTTLRASLEDASASRCEACGTSVTPPPPLFAGRNHCPKCALRYEALCSRGVENPLVRLWEEKGQVRYPRA